MSSAVSPVTAVWTPGTRPSVSGTSTLRSSRTEFPARGVVAEPGQRQAEGKRVARPDQARCRTVGGRSRWRAASASSRATAARTAARSVAGQVATTIAGDDVLGNSPVIRAASSDCPADDSAAELGFATCIPNAGTASAISSPADMHADSTGRRSTRSTTPVQNLDSPAVASCGRNRMRPRSTRGPSSRSSAGRT